MDPVALSVIIPAYNEEARIAGTLTAVRGALAAVPGRSEILVVDDGSRDRTAALVRSSGDPAVRLIMQSRNLGKGAAVKRGMLEAAGDIAFFMDADLSVSAEQLPACIAFMRDGNHPILIGSRRAPGGAMVIPQPAVRQTLGQCFTFFTRMLLVGEIQDFTCGFKGFRRDVGRLLFAAQQHADWSFDAEVLYLARLLGIPVHQYPVRWEHRDGSRVRFPRDIIKTSIALFQIRLRTPLVARRLSGPAPGLVPEGVRHT